MGTIGLTEVAVGVPFPAAALEICRYAMGTVSVRRDAAGARTSTRQTALQRGWIDAVVPPEDLLSQAIATARALGAHSPFAYAATKDNCTGPPARPSTPPRRSTRGARRLAVGRDIRPHRDLSSPALK